MSSTKKEKVQGRFYTTQDLIDLAKEVSEDLNIPAGKIMEIAVYYITHCKPSERTSIIAKYFDPNWPGKDKDDE